ncbi:Carboxypeptidase Q [Aphelenchoides fujianensis]|nr:Carboxypeptidase Q [Aphelenchoides fujianensis]
MAADRKPFALRAVLLLASAVLLANAGVIEENFGASVHDLIEHITTAKESVNTGFEWLEPLVDDFGNRMLCTDRLEKAIDYMFEGLQADGFDNTHTEEIVIYNQPWQNYFDDYLYRRASEKVKKQGAVGLLAKSVGPFSIGSPHTGSGTDQHLPAASLTLEEAEMLQRLVKRNKTLKINMDIRSKNVGTCTSKNIVFDIKGSEFPNEIVLLSGHSDTWDLGQGALDDGGGMAAVWQGMKALQRLAKKDKRFQPKRTIRAVFWTAEEPGFHGANAYYAAHKNTSEEFVFVSETDQGAFRPTSNESMFRFQGNATHRARLQEIVELLQANGIPLSIQEGAQGDVQPWADDGVPSINYVADRGIDFYFYFHHTQGDYLNVFKEGDIDFTAAILATLGHVLAGQDSWF